MKKSMHIAAAALFLAAAAASIFALGTKEVPLETASGGGADDCGLVVCLLTSF